MQSAPLMLKLMLHGGDYLVIRRQVTATSRQATATSRQATATSRQVTATSCQATATVGRSAGDCKRDVSVISANENVRSLRRRRRLKSSNI